MINYKTLRFKDTDGGLEHDFNEWYLPTEIKLFRYALLLGIITYFVFIPLDNLLYNDFTATQFLYLRIIISTVVSIAYALTYKWINNYNQFQIFAIVVSLICFGGNVCFTFFEKVDNFYFYTGDSILIIFVFILLNIRFSYLRFIAIFFVIVHLFMLKLNFDYDVQKFAHQTYGILSIVIISLASNWIIEFQKRQNFMNKRLIETQKETLQQNILEKDALLERLKEHNQELDMFNRSVSHDLKTPLRNINVFSKLLERQYKNTFDGEGQEYLNFIVKGTSKMNTLIDDLLAYSKIRHKALNYTTVDMDILVENIFLEQVQVLEKSPKLTKDVLPIIKGDKVLLSQVWNNLISNAIKYASNKECIHLTIGAKQNQDTITYFIQDNGVGFDMKLAPLLFEPFKRLHSDEAFKGTGVGLSLVDRIIKKHKGKIWAKSEPNKGSTFYIQLPIE